jgi:hypothetical protein
MLVERSIPVLERLDSDLDLRFDFDLDLVWSEERAFIEGEARTRRLSTRTSGTGALTVSKALNLLVGDDHHPLYRTKSHRLLLSITLPQGITDPNSMNDFFPSTTRFSGAGQR